MLKKVLISLGIILVASGLMVGILFAIKQAQPQPETEESSEVEADPTKTVADLSKDYGACTLLTVEFIKTTLGDSAKDLQEPQNMGIVNENNVGPGVEGIVSDSHTCAYPFVLGGAIEDGFNNGNGLNVQVTMYQSSDDAIAMSTQIRESGMAESIDGLGDAAFYTYSDDERGLSEPTNTFKLQVFKDQKLTSLTLRQPTETSAFNAETGRDVLVKLAEQADQ